MWQYVKKTTSSRQKEALPRKLISGAQTKRFLLEVVLVMVFAAATEKSPGSWHQKRDTAVKSWPCWVFWRNVEDWTRKEVEHCKWGLVGQTKRSWEDKGAESNVEVDNESLAQEVPNNIGDGLQTICDVLPKNLSAFAIV